MPIAELRRLDQLVSPTAMRTVLEQLDQEYGDADGQGGWSKTAVMISTALVNLARRWASLSPQELTEVEELHRLVKAPRGGLSRRNRDKLAQFSSNGDRAELYELPDRALAEAQQRLRNAKSKDRGIMAAKMHETALALKILLTQPLRSGDLERIDIVEHLQRDRRGRLHRLAIRTHKTRRKVDVLLPPDLVAAIERHITTFRPLLPGADKGSALFPGPSGLHRARGSIGRHIRRLVMRQLGALFTPHLARHLSAEIILDHDPNGLPIVQRLLGHGTLSRTQEMYGVTRTSAAQKSYTALVEDLRGKAHAKQASAKPRQPRSRREAL
jgi:integrase